MNYSEFCNNIITVLGYTVYYTVYPSTVCFPLHTVHPVYTLRRPTQLSTGHNPNKAIQPVSTNHRRPIIIAST